MPFQSFRPHVCMRQIQAKARAVQVREQISQRQALGWEYADLAERHGHNLQVIEDLAAGMA